jgi:hypothetical protein
MVSRMMKEKLTSDDIALSHEMIKLFLLLTLRLSLIRNHNDQKTPRPFTGGNFLGLLNLKKQMEDHGSLRNIWDGDCEKMIQDPKPYLHNRQNKVSYYKARFESLLYDNKINEFMSMLNPYLFKMNANGTNKNIEKSRTNPMFVNYKCLGSVEERISNGDIIFGFIMEENMYIAVEDRKISTNYKFYNINWDARSVKYHMGVYYSALSIDISKHLSIDNQNLEVLERFAAMVPPSPKDDQDYCLGSKMDESGNKKYMYSIVTNQWREIKSNNSFSAPFVDVKLIDELTSEW